jgi:hypothetical protein
MADRKRASFEMMLFHLEAASSFAEELGDTRNQEIIDRAKSKVEQRETRLNRSPPIEQ